MKILGVIPARSGSKSIPHKNITPLLGKPLIEYTFDAALGCKHLDRTILSTDDESYAALAKKHGIEVPFLRSPELAKDDTGMAEVLQDILRKLAADSYYPDAITLLQPTSPLRRTEHIDSAIEHFCTTKANTLVSVQEVPHQFSPSSLMRLDDGFLVPAQEGKMILRRQDKPKLYARNGPAILIADRATLESGRLYGDKIVPFTMDAADSVDIDGPIDLLVAETILRNLQANQ